MDSHFENDVITKWLTSSEGDRDMELTEDFAFVEPGERWEAPAGSVVNGASIPAGLWSIVGCPFVGDYRRSAVIHDVYYRDHRGKTRKEVDEAFLRAMLTDGVSKKRARLMYAGVRVGGGPAWDTTELERAAFVDWLEFEAWFETEAEGLSKEALDRAIRERFGPVR